MTGKSRTGGPAGSDSLVGPKLRRVGHTRGGKKPPPLDITSDLPTLTDIYRWERDLLLPCARKLLAALVDDKEANDG